MELVFFTCVPPQSSLEKSPMDTTRTFWSYFSPKRAIAPDFFADLILYSIPLHAYIVVELKATPFKPEYAGQLNFYINVVDDKLRGENDNKTIGLLLCKGKDEVVAQYALTGYDQPIGISDYQLSKAIPENLKSALPSIEEVEEELTSFLDKDKNP